MASNVCPDDTVTLAASPGAAGDTAMIAPVPEAILKLPAG
jgi:hypothetical protein